MTAPTPAQLAVTEAFMIAANHSGTLYELAADYADLLYRLDDADLDLQDANQLEAIVAELAGKITEKAEGIACVVNELEYRAAAQRAEARRLSERAASRERKAEWLQAYLQREMQVIGTKRIETVRYSLSIRQNPPAVHVLEAAMVPAEYQRTKIETTVDKKAILADHKATGVIPPGVEIVRAERLEIK